MRRLCSVWILMLCVSALFAQKVKVGESDYRRSSICMILMDEAKMPKRDTIKEAFLSAVIPDKYNDHNVVRRSFDPASLTVSVEDEALYKQAVAEGKNDKGKAGKKGSFGKLIKEVGKGVLSETTTLVDAANKDSYGIITNKYLLQENVAKQMFDKWFLDSVGDFSMELVKKRGIYDASVMDVQTAKSSKKGMGMLEDAGEELINNTFVIVSRFRYLSKEELTAEIDAAAKSLAQQIGSDYLTLGTMAIKASLGAGYYVRTTSYLFQLKWNEEIAYKLYADLWDKPEAYHAADIFSFRYIGTESAWANVKAGIFTQKDEAELVRIATVNATDAVLAKLEKKYDVFKTKTPLLSTDPLTAYIGLKEGVEPGDRYEVLEKIMDPETNKTRYERKAVLKVTKDKTKIWDNRFMADEEHEAAGTVQGCTATHFEGNAKGLASGHLLRQIK